MPSIPEEQKIAGEMLKLLLTPCEVVDLKKPTPNQQKIAGEMLQFFPK